MFTFAPLFFTLSKKTTKVATLDPKNSVILRSCNWTWKTFCSIV